MSRLLDAPGFMLSQEQRMEALVEGVGGPNKAAQLTGISRGTIANWRKPGADLSLLGVLPLCMHNGKSLDWLATGYQVRPDLAAVGVSEGFAPQDAFGALPGFVRLLPLKPIVSEAGDRRIEQHDPSDFAVSHSWLDQRGLRADDVRYAVAGDAGMAPIVPFGATVVVDNRPSKLRSGIYLVEVGDELLVRRLNMLPGAQVELVADANPAWRYSVSGPDAEKLPLRRVIWFAADL